jgi:hypothetical protein
MPGHGQADLHRSERVASIDPAQRWLTIVISVRQRERHKPMDGLDVLMRGTLTQLLSGLHRRQTSAPPPEPTRNWTVFSFSNCMSTPCPDEGSLMGHHMAECVRV